MVMAALRPESPAARQTWRIGLKGACTEDGLFTQTEQLAGIEYNPLTLGNSQVGTFDACEQMGITFAQPVNNLLWLGWGIYAQESCYSLGALSVEDAHAKAVAKLERQTSHLTEEVLWTGLLDVGTNFATLNATITPNANNRPFASDSATLFDGGGPHDIVDALGHICEWAASVAGGERLWIHVEPKLVPFLAFYGLAVRDSSRSLGLALGDHRIVAGTGYAGTGPPAEVTQSGESWIYVTTPVRFYQSPITPQATEEGALNRSENRYQVAATRIVLAEWDETVHGAIRVCTPGPGPDCTTTGS